MWMSFLLCLCHFLVPRSKCWWPESRQVCNQSIQVLDKNRSVDSSCKPGLPSYIHDRNGWVYYSLQTALCSYQHASAGGSQKEDGRQPTSDSLFSGWFYSVECKVLLCVDIRMIRLSGKKKCQVTMATSLHLLISEHKLMKPWRSNFKMHPEMPNARRRRFRTS